MLVHQDWLLTPKRAAIHLPTATAVIADLHLGYNDARCRSGEAVPVSDLEELLAPLGRSLAANHARRLVIAGDLFELTYCDTIAGQLLEWLKRRQIELAAVIPGNHDRGIQKSGVCLPVFAEGFRIGGWHVAHGDGKLPRSSVVYGHFHPCFRHGSIKSACYLIGPRRILLPAYSADARGVNVLRVAAWQCFRCCIPVGSAVLDFGDVGKLRLSLAGPGYQPEV